MIPLGKLVWIERESLSGVLRFVRAVSDNGGDAVCQCFAKFL